VESLEIREAMKMAIGKFRYLLFLVVALISLFTALALAAGYVWSGAWLRAPVAMIPIVFLIGYFSFGWLLVRSVNRWAIQLLYGLSLAALVIAVGAYIVPDWLPVIVRIQDILVIFALPSSAYVFRRLKAA
jgi:hypothetical protein